MNTIIKILIFLIIPSLVLASEVVLKSGQKVEGKIVEQKDKYVKFDSGVGVVMTYYIDEIDTIDGQKLQTSKIPMQTSTETQNIVEAKKSFEELKKAQATNDAVLEKKYITKKTLDTISQEGGRFSFNKNSIFLKDVREDGEKVIMAVTTILNNGARDDSNFIFVKEDGLWKWDELTWIQEQMFKIIKPGHRIKIVAKIKEATLGEHLLAFTTPMEVQKFSNYENGDDEYHGCITKDYKIVIRNEELIVNDKSYGKLNAKDSITLDHGKILVNLKEKEGIVHNREAEEKLKETEERLNKPFK